MLLVILERVVHSGLNFLLLNKSHVLHNEVYDFLDYLVCELIVQSLQNSSVIITVETLPENTAFAVCGSS